MGSDNGKWKLRLWCWILGIIGVAVLAVIIFCHIIGWLIWIGAFTVAAIVIAIIVMAVRLKDRVEDDIRRHENRDS